MAGGGGGGGGVAVHNHEIQLPLNTNPHSAGIPVGRTCDVRFVAKEDVVSDVYAGHETLPAQHTTFNTLDNWGHKNPTQSKRIKDRKEKVKGSCIQYTRLHLEVKRILLLTIACLCHKGIHMPGLCAFYGNVLRRILPDKRRCSRGAYSESAVNTPSVTEQMTESVHTTSLWPS